MGGMYKKRYYRENYRRIWVRRNAYDAYKRYCLSRGIPFSECLEKLVEEAEKPCTMSRELEELIDSAVKLASKHPYEPESKKIFTLWEKIIG